MLRDPDSSLIGCVAFEPQRCGQELVPTALRAIEGKAVPPAVFVGHKVLTIGNGCLVRPIDRASRSQIQWSRGPSQCWGRNAVA